MAFLTMKDPRPRPCARDGRWGYAGPTPGAPRRQAFGLIQRTNTRLATLGQPSADFAVRSFAGHPFHQQANAELGFKRTSRACSTSRTTRSSGHPRSAEGRGADDYDGDAVFYFPAAVQSACSRGRPGDGRQCSITSARRPCCPWLPVLRLPQIAALAITTRARKITTDNRVLFHRVANTLNYLDINTVIVSCGTCMDQLAEVPVRADFPRLPPARHPTVPATGALSSTGITGTSCTTSHCRR